MNSPVRIMKKFLNRSALLIIPKQPYIDWAWRATKGHLEVDPEECGCYLVDNEWDDKEVKGYLKQHYDDIFVDFLAGACSFHETWPEKRSWKLFNEWFEWRFSGYVFDQLPEKRIRREKF